MEPSSKYITSIFNILALVLLGASTVAGSCTFPSSIRGVWDRSRDNKELTFTSTTVSGFGLTYFATPLPDFECHTKSGDKYILASDFLTTSSQSYRYLVCWQLQKVTSSAYILYELTSNLGDANITPDQPGKTQPQADAVNVGTICDVSTDYFTALIKDGASSNDVAARCPSSLFANFEYTQCAGSSLVFCTDRTTATADYTSCPAILNSAGGILSCMGHVEVGSYTYINLFKHDAGNGITCVRLESGSNGAVSAKYYSGDCSTAGGSSTALDMTPTKKCPLGGDGGDTATGAIIGSTVTVVGISAVGILVALYFLKMKKKGKVSDVEKPMTVMTENTTTSMTVKPSDAPVATTTANGTTANGTAMHSSPQANGAPANSPTTDEEFPSPRRNPQLPPLPNVTSHGEPLRA